MAQPKLNVATLPVYIIGKPQLRGILRELQYMDDVLHQQKLVSSVEAAASANVAAGSRGLSELALSRGYRLDSGEDRRQMVKDVQSLIETAPEYHISFASEPPVRKLQQLTQWFRENVHPQLLIQVGLQPPITAGCVVRTGNSVIDLSLRRSFDAAFPALLKEIQVL